MRKSLSICLCAALLACLLPGCGGEKVEAPETKSGTVVLYAAMQEEVLEALKEDFEEKYPQVELDCYNAAVHTVLNRIRAEAQTGQVRADVLWVGDARDAEEFKELGVLRKYSSPQAKSAIDSSYQDPEGYYTMARIAAMGLVVNTDLAPVSRISKTWIGMVEPDWKGRIAVVDPSLSAAADYWACAMLGSRGAEHGSYYIRRLKRSECQMESSFASLMKKVQNGERAMGVCPDYLAHQYIKEGASVAFIYPTDTIVVGTPLALVKDSADPDCGELLYDYLLSQEGQQLLADHGMDAVRNDVAQRAVPDAIAAMAMDCDPKTMRAERDKTLAAFNEILGL